MAAPDAGQVTAAKQELAALTAPLAAGYRPAPGRYLLHLAWLTACGAGLRLLADPGMARALGGASAAGLYFLVIAGQLSPWAARYRARLAARAAPPPPWTAAAAIHCQSLPGRADPATLAAAARYLPAMAARYPEAYFYIASCTGTCTRLCRSAVTCVPDGRLLVILGEHLAADPVTAAGTLAHELRHLHGWPLRAADAAAGAASGWGWAAAGAAWAATGLPWPWLPAFPAALHLAATAAGWAVECGCDHAAARAEGRPALLHAIDFLAAQNPAAPRRARRALALAAGSPHPPYALRRAVIRAAGPRRRTTGRAAKYPPQA
jgi:hypothetical protein